MLCLAIGRRAAVRLLRKKLHNWPERKRMASQKDLRDVRYAVNGKESVLTRSLCGRGS
jgi:hypothetical protein